MNVFHSLHSGRWSSSSSSSSCGGALSQDSTHTSSSQSDPDEPLVTNATPLNDLKDKVAKL